MKSHEQLLAEEVRATVALANDGFGSEREGEGTVAGPQPTYPIRTINDERKGVLLPRQYALAYCSGGLLGLITSERPLDIQYNDKTWAQAWIGLQVSGGTIAGRGGDMGKTFRRYPGTPWSSKTPEVIALLSPNDGAYLELKLKQLAIADYNPGATP